MVSDAGPAILAGTTQPLAGLPEPGEATRIILDDPAFAAEVGASPDTGRRVPLAPGHPAYVIYTSGSTGTPKGVVVTHSGVASLAASQVGALHLHPGARVLQFASLNFDAAFWELCMSLLSGAALVMADSDQLPPHGSLAALTREFGVTHLTLPPAVLAALPVGEELPDSLETLVLAGEACPPGLVDRWSGGRLMVNAYGPTEATVCTAMTGPLTGGAALVPIGPPIPNTPGLVLDEVLQPVAPGVTGELYLAGAGLARCYLG